MSVHLLMIETGIEAGDESVAVTVVEALGVLDETGNPSIAATIIGKAETGDLATPKEIDTTWRLLQRTWCLGEMVATGTMVESVSIEIGIAHDVMDASESRCESQTRLLGVESAQLEESVVLREVGGAEM